MSQATGASARTETEIVQKKERKKKGAGLLPALGQAAKEHKKAGQSIELARDQARAAETQRAEENLRMLKILRTNFGPRVEANLKSSINCEAEDLAFLRNTFGFNV